MYFIAAKVIYFNKIKHKKQAVLQNKNSLFYFQTPL